MKKLNKNAIRVLELFGEDELEVYQNFQAKERTSYIAIYYNKPRSINAKVYAPSEWLRSRKNGISAHNETAKMILDNFDSSEFECYKKWSYRDRCSYTAYIGQLSKTNKEITLKDCPSEWHKRLLEKRAKYSNLAGKNTRIGRKPAKKEPYSNEIKQKPFSQQIIELFSSLELEFFENMIVFAKKYYKAHVRKNLQAGFKIKKPSEWYDDFIISTQCPEMLRLQNRFFGLVKREISRKDAKEYIAYFEAMAYQKERNYCL